MVDESTALGRRGAAGHSGGAQWGSPVPFMAAGQWGGLGSGLWGRCILPGGWVTLLRPRAPTSHHLVGQQTGTVEQVAPGQLSGPSPSLATRPQPPCPSSQPSPDHLGGLAPCLESKASVGGDRGSSPRHYRHTASAQQQAFATARSDPQPAQLLLRNAATLASSP